MNPLAILPDRFLGWNAGRLYLQTLLTSAMTVGDRPEIVVLAREQDAHHDAVRAADRVLTYRSHAFSDRVRGVIAARFNGQPPLPRHTLRRLNPSAIFGNQLSQSIGRSATVANVLDYQDRYYPHHSPARVQKREMENGLVASAAHGILFNSETSRRDYVSRYAVNRAATAVVPLQALIAPADLTADPQQVRIKYHLPDRYVVVPSQLWEHKNHRQLLAAMAVLASRGVALTAVLTGMPYDPRVPLYTSEMLQSIAHLGLRNAIVLLGQLDRPELVALIRASSGVVQPSLHEGGGLPAEEARALGKPIVLADLPLQREAAIPDASYFAPENPESLADAISQHLCGRPGGVDALAEKRALLNSHERFREVGRQFLSLVAAAQRVAGGGRSSVSAD
jgi:glycosyltransferase involved in cell wall biosynthesis